MEDLNLPESRVEAMLKRRVKEAGGRFRKAHWVARRGAPDDLVWWPTPNRVKHPMPIAAFVEVKRPGKLPTIQQAHEHKLLRQDGWEVWVVDSFDAVECFVLHMLARCAEAH